MAGIGKRLILTKKIFFIPRMNEDIGRIVAMEAV
jgi:hypothetical protein